MADNTLTPEQAAALLNTPLKVVGDEGSVEERKVSELIALDRHIANKQAAGRPPFGMTISRVAPRGTV